MTYLTLGQKWIHVQSLPPFLALQYIIGGGNKRLKYITRPAAAQLVSALVFSHIDYGNSLLAGLPASRLHPLQKAQYAAARVVTGTRRRDPMTRHLKDLHWLPISYRIDFKIAVLVWRCLNGCAPSYLSSLLNRSSLGSRTLRSLPPPLLYMTFLFLLLASNPTADAPSPTMLPICGIACQFPSALVPPFKDFVPLLRPTYFVKLSITSFPVSIESCLQRL